MQTQNVLRLILTLGCLACCSLVLRADTLSSPSAGAGWQSWSPSNLYQGTSPTAGTPYWNNLSGDGYQGNIGWCLNGGGSTCNYAGTPPGALPYFGTSAGAAVSNMYFTASGTPTMATIAGINTSQTSAGSYDIFGYYLVSSGALTPLFSLAPGQSVTGSTASLDLSSGTEYGFYIESILGAGTADESDYYFYMNSALNNWFFNGVSQGSPDGVQHFAVFQSPTGFVVGDTNSFACANPSQVGTTPCELASQFDYNDIIVTLVPTPEPGTVCLLGLSLCLLAASVHRTRRN